VSEIQVKRRGSWRYSIGLTLIGLAAGGVGHAGGAVVVRDLLGVVDGVELHLLEALRVHRVPHVQHVQHELFAGEGK
jgi:hypothetical protein